MKIRKLWREQLHWDGNQRLTASVDDGQRTEYGYDALGRRVFKETAGRRTRFGWDGDVLTAEASGRAAGGPAFGLEHVYYPQTVTPLAQLVSRPAGPTLLFYQTDPNGAPNRLVDAHGELQWEDHRGRARPA